MKNVIKRFRVYTAFMLLTATLVGCPVNPATGERQLILISEGSEISMGREGAKQVEAAIGLYDNPDLQAYVNEIGQQLAARSEKPSFPWTFKVVDDPVVNAFALPGGFIFVTRGILGHFNTEAEMAAVLGHEIGHVTARHSAEQLSRAQVAQLGLGVGSIFVPEIAAYGDVLGLGLGLMFLRFGRDDERQADDLGLRYMERGGYDPNEMVDVFVLLGRVSAAAGGGSLPSWLSTHPDPGERRERITAAIAAGGGSPGGTIARDRYLQRVDGIVFGDNPRNGFFRQALFLHPDLQFQLQFPNGWQTQNMAQAVAGMSPDKDALIQLSVTEGPTAGDAAQKFLSQQGIQASTRSSAPVNGLAASWAYFGAPTQQGESLRGLVVFIEHRGQVFQVLGYTLAGRMSAYEPVFRQTLASFDQLRDRSALDVQPKRIELVRLNRSMTLEQFAAAYPSTVPTATLALINGVEETATLQANRLVKRVVGEGMPEQK